MHTLATCPESFGQNQNFLEKFEFVEEKIFFKIT